MMQQIAPRQYFPISRVLPDPSDNTTYFIMAVVRNGSTGATLASVPLLPQGSQIYSAVYRAPALASSQGLFLTITTTVYTDAGYSILSQLYGNDQDTFQVFDSVNLAIIQAQQIAATVAGSIPVADMDYKKVAQVMARALESVIKTFSAEFEKVNKRLDDIDGDVDLSPVLQAIGEKNLDISPLGEKIEEKHQALLALLAPLKDTLETLASRLPEGGIDMEPVLAALELLKPSPEANRPIEALQKTADRILDTAGRTHDHAEAAHKTLMDIPVFTLAAPPAKKPDGIKNIFGQIFETKKA